MGYTVIVYYFESCNRDWEAKRNDYAFDTKTVGPFKTKGRAQDWINRRKCATHARNFKVVKNQKIA